MSINMLIRIFLAWLFHAALSHGALTSRPNGGSSNHTKFLFVLGDSYSNLAFDPDGTQPWPGNIFGNTDMVKKVPEDAALTLGPNWVSDLSMMYNTSEILTYDLAFDCAVVNASLISDDCPWALAYNVSWQTDAVSQIIVNQSPYANFEKENTLFSYFIGINDVSIPVKNYRLGVEDILWQDLEDLFDQIERVYTLGFRNFLLLDVPPFDRAPQIRDAKNSTYAAAQEHAIAIWNSSLRRQYQSWIDRHEDVKAVLFNTTDVFDHVLDHPEDFGANKTGASCWGALPDCLWADDFHPGPALHKQLAKEIGRSAGEKLPGWFQVPENVVYSQTIRNLW